MQRTEEDKAKLGRYKKIWLVLRERKTLTINLQTPAHSSAAQVQATAKTIVKAVVKEKYEDIQFRKDNPNCRLRSHFTSSARGDKLDFWFENIKGMELDKLLEIDLSTL